jgi:hypothetical protein
MGLEFEAGENQICNSFAQIDYNENHMSWISHGPVQKERSCVTYLLSSYLEHTI